MSLGTKLAACAALFSLAWLAGCTQSADRLGEGLSVKSAVAKIVPTRAYSYTEKDRECLARAMFFESNRSSRDGLVAVGSVVMNRVESRRWGDDICGVVGAKRQFAPGVLSRKMDAKALPDVMAAADSVLKGERHPKVQKEVMFFHTAGLKFPYKNMHYTTVAGGNAFYEKRSRRKPPMLEQMDTPAEMPQTMIAAVEQPQSAPVEKPTVVAAAEAAPQPAFASASMRSGGGTIARQPRTSAAPQPAAERFGGQPAPEAQTAEVAMDGQFDTAEPVLGYDVSSEQATEVGEILLQQQLGE